MTDILSADVALFVVLLIIGGYGLVLMGED